MRCLMTEGFFTDYPLFYSNSRVGTKPPRLAKRHTVLIEQQSDLIAGKRVLDIASHDGRWSFAALKAGASHVTGIELCPELVSTAESTFKQYGIPKTDYRFMTGDFFDVAPKLEGHFDTVFLFGFLYHTLKHAELFYNISRLKPGTIIVDTRVALVPGPYIEIKKDPAPVGYPTVDAVSMILSYLGYGSEIVDWQPYLGDNCDGVHDYASGTRVTIIGRN